MKIRQILSKKSVEMALTAAICVAAVSGAAVAGTDSTFTTTVTSLTGWANGSLGKLVMGAVSTQVLANCSVPVMLIR